MVSDAQRVDEWDVDKSDGAAETEVANYLFDNAEENEVRPGFVNSISSGKTKYWTPTCDDAMKPYIGQKFNSLEDGIAFYRKYAALVGFDVRLTGNRVHKDGTVLYRYLICNREGHSQPSTSAGKRRRASNRVGCKANVLLKFMGLNGYVITTMVEDHSHALLQDESNRYLKANRKLDFGQQRFMIECERARLGPAATHRLMQTTHRCAKNGGPMLQDLSNFKRDIMAYISPADAQMVIDRFKIKQQTSSAFYYAFDIDKDNKLVRLFWCDPIARANYAAFGDVLSFDSTYRSNKYSMVFAPFTGMDNHRAAVTFAAGLLLNEDIPSFTWLFKHFQNAMRKDPLVIVTDQDPAMKEALPAIFPNTRHRFCMWHIMMKVPKQVSAAVCAKEGFREKLNAAVWSYGIGVDEFERRWKELLIEYDLTLNKWLELMFSLRDNWIPAYFRDVMLGGLIRTTSISESANSFFGNYYNRHFTLVELMMNFDGAMDAQRNAQSKLDMECETQVKRYLTPLEFEKHAALVYTNKVFDKVQDEIYYASFNCHVTNELVDVDKKKHVVKEDGIGLFDVVFDVGGDQSKCSCNMFFRIGIPCSHIFATYKYMGIKHIPAPMILPRWTKEARRAQVDDDVHKQCSAMEANKMLLDKLWSTIYATVGVVEDSAEYIKDLTKTLTQKQKQYGVKVVHPDSSIARKHAFVEEFTGVKPPELIDIHPPPPTKNKGRRIKGAVEKATEKAAKPLRKCGWCKKMQSHDKRNCKEILSGEEDQEEDDDDEGTDDDEGSDDDVYDNDSE